MDTWSIREAARDLGTTVPRVQRALDGLGIDPPAGPRGRRVSAVQLAMLRDRLGSAPRVDGYTREDLFVLAALNRRPAGVRSVRAVARAAGVSATSAGRVLRRLSDKGLVTRRVRRFLEGRVVDGVLYEIRREAEWRAVADAVRATVVPVSALPVETPKRVPRRLWHHFWNANPATIVLPSDENYVAARLLRADDPQALAWAAANLSVEAITHAAMLRGVTGRERSLMQHLIRAAR